MSPAHVLRKLISQRRDSGNIKEDIKEEIVIGPRGKVA
jgi:hypothetical protein